MPRENNPEENGEGDEIASLKNEVESVRKRTQEIYDIGHTDFYNEIVDFDNSLEKEGVNRKERERYLLYNALIGSTPSKGWENFDWDAFICGKSDFADRLDFPEEKYSVESFLKRMEGKYKNE